MKQALLNNLSATQIFVRSDDHFELRVQTGLYEAYRELERLQAAGKAAMLQHAGRCVKTTSAWLG